MKHTLILGALFLLAVPYITFAGPIIRSGDDVSVADNQVLEGDFYGAGETVTISGVAENDVVVAGSNVTLDGEVAGDVAIAGMTVNVHSNVNDDVRIVGGDIKISKNVKGDVVVAGGALKIMSSAVIEGDVIFWGNDITIEGEVLGSVHGRADRVRIDGPIGGDVEYTVSQQLVLGEEANVEGDIIYGGPELVRSQNAVVVGNIQHTSTSFEKEGSSHAEIFLFLLLIVLFSGLSMYFIARETAGTIIEKSLQRVGFNGLIGLGVLVATPFVSMLLVVSIVGSVVGVIALLGYLVFLLISVIITIIMLGHLFGRYVLKNEQYTVFTPFLGSILFVLVMYVPFIGGLAILALVLINLGSITTGIYHKLRA